MLSLLSRARAGAADVIDRAVEGFESAWDAERPSLGQYWQGCKSSGSISVLAALVKVDLRRRFERDDRPRVADYLDEFPDLAEDRDRVVSLVYEEFCLREEYGEAPDSREFCEAYGPWRDSLLSQLAYHRQLSQAVGAESPPVVFPEVGEQFANYQIRSLLGRGGVARVYLATENGLGDRKVALKVSSSFGQEPSILANLDHRNIVPILAVAESESGLLGFSMPYRPGVTLDALVKQVGRGKLPRSARALWEAIGSPEDGGPGDERAGWAGYPTEGTFSEGVAWIGLALSNALAYLHREGVIHRDIKPANVLLAFREGPQLLDFNLAQDPRSAEQAKVAFKGGTLPYMAPEHLSAFIDPSDWEDVGSASDIYSLGLVLRQLVTGRAPELPEANLSVARGIRSLLDRRREPIEPVRDLNPAVPPALESIISKCLAVAPADRYAGGSDLAEDLRLFLDRKSLRHAPNTSKVERTVNFTYRHRFLAVGLLSLLSIALITKFVLTPTPVQKLTKFRQAVARLDSDRPEDWRRACVDFDELRKGYLGSAWPLLYLGLAQEKIGGRRLEASTRNIADATKAPDAEEAISERLKSDSRSATLLTALGLTLAAKNDLDRARQAFNRAIESDPLRIEAHLQLNKLETGPLKNEMAIQSFTRAIEFGECRRTSPELLFDFRQRILPRYARKVEPLIDSGQTRKERGQAAVDLDRIESTLKAMKGDLERMKSVSGGQSFRNTESFYRGFVASCRVVLAGDRDDSIEASRLVEVGRRCFDEAWKSIQEGAEKSRELRNEVESQREKLEKRFQKYVSARRPDLPPPAVVDR